MNLMRTAITAISLMATSAIAQTYPAKQIRYVVPFPPGGATDILARVISQKLNESWGQPVIIDNRSGATGTIGSDIVAKSAPDGYTLLGGTIATHAISSSLNSKLPYHPLKNFAPVTLLATLPNVLIVHPAMPVRNVKEFVALAKARPNDMRFSSGGAGTSQHLSGELFNMLIGTKLVHVPYKGGHLAMGDIVGGQIEFAFENAPNCMPYLLSKRLRPLGVTTVKRSASLPDVPPVADTIPGFDVVHWYGIWGPKALPQPIVTRWNREVARILKTDAMQKWFANEGMEPAGGLPEQFYNRIKSDTEKWKRVVREAKIPVAG